MSAPLPAPENQAPLDEWVEAARQAWHKKIGYKPPEEPRGLLYHYTTPAGLAGIVDSNSLWASAARYSNDESEVAYSCELGNSVIEKARASLDRTDSAAKGLLLFVSGMFSSADRPPQDAYSVSFSEEGDQLGQWRGYGKNGGFALGFDVLAFNPLLKAKLVQFTNDQKARIFLRKVEYDRNRQEEQLLRILQSHIELLKGLGKFPEDLAVPIVAGFCSYSSAEWMYSVKDRVFEEEREWRIVCVPAIRPLASLEFGAEYLAYTGVGVRPTLGGRMIPYLVLKPVNQLLPIKSLICGPSHDRVLAARAAELLFRSKGYDDVRIEMSNVPLRWA